MLLKNIIIWSTVILEDYRDVPQKNENIITVTQQPHFWAYFYKILNQFVVGMPDHPYEL